MPKPPAEFRLYKRYGGDVQIKFYPNSHRYKVYDEKYKRDWEISPSATGLTGSMDKGTGLMVYAMSEAMKYIDNLAGSRTLKFMIDDEKFTLKQMFKDARAAHIKKSNLGKEVGTKSHAWVEELLNRVEAQQKTKSQLIVPAIPKAKDIKTELSDSWAKISDVHKIEKRKDLEKFFSTIERDVDIRSQMWEEATMIQNSCLAAKEFFVAAIKDRVLYVHGVEQIVHSRKHFFTGLFDSILEFKAPFTWKGYTIPKGIYVTDFKTSNAGTDYPMGIYPNYLAQAGLYDIALCEEFPEWDKKLTGHLILGSSKHGDGFRPYVAEDRKRNCEWAASLPKVMHHMQLGERELKGKNVYGG